MRGAYFVTVCTLGKACLFGRVREGTVTLSRLGRLVQDEWRRIPMRWPHVELDDFVVMPNHLHGIVWLVRAGQAPPLHRVVGAFKAGTSRLARRRLWQRSFHDRIIRDEDELRAKRQYIADNPVKWATDPENPKRRPP